jgi:hydrogenase maturation protease
MSISSTTRRARIIGLGTPFGDDRVGWDVVSLLHQMLPDETCASTTSDPFVVTYEPTEKELLIVIDACHGAGLPGSVHRFEWPDPSLVVDGSMSCHGAQLTAALELAHVLGRLPRQVIVFAIEAESSEPETGLSPVVEAAVSEVVARVMAELALG